MKYYDYKKAKDFIEANKERITSASLGMHEDWFWTANEIYRDGEYLHKLPENGLDIEMEYLEKRRAGMSVFSEEAMAYDHHIGGLFGSSFATPTLEVEYADGTSDNFECSMGEYDDSYPDRIEKQVRLPLGCLSEPCQNARDILKKKL